MIDLNWLDAVLVAVVALTTVLGIKRGLPAFFVAAVAVLLLRPLLVVTARSPIVGLAAALVGGALLAILAARMPANRRQPKWYWRALGGVGGLAFGAALVVAFVTSLPIERSDLDARQIYYPPRNAPLELSTTLQRSKLVTVGRSVLLYPLLPEPESAAERSVYQNLRAWFVVGEPWR